ncbi:MAG: carboxypeptidase-like regulatory domain-containing protein, partial [Saprospiraceae bacterium]
MKGYIFIALLCAFSASLWSQQRPDDKVLTYAAYNKSLKIVLNDLSKLSGTNIVYSESRIPSDKIINISAKDEKLGSILIVIFKDLHISYQIVGNQIVIVKNKSPLQMGDIRLFGYIRDKSSGEFLIGANIFLHDKSRGASTNAFGFFSFQVPKQELRIHFSYLGYESTILDLYALKDTMMYIQLNPDGLLNEIVILDDLLEEEHETTASQQNLHIDKIRASNHLAGEADLFRYISTQAGVTTAAEGVGGLNVRGGSADQNLVLLDGVPLYNTGHAMGIFSVFNSDAVKNASFYKGGIPARYAGRLSSVIDVHTRDGNFKKLSGEATLSTIAFKGSLEGPIIKDKSSFILSYRRTFMDVWVKELTKSQNKSKNLNGSANYFFSDFNAKINFRLGKNTRINFQTLYSGDDFSNFTGVADDLLRDEHTRSIAWGNQLYSLKLNHQLGKSWFSNTTVYNTKYKFKNFKNNLYEYSSGIETVTAFDASIFESNISETGIKQEFDWMASRAHSIKIGGNVQFRVFSPLITSVNETDFEPRITVLSQDKLRSLYEKSLVKGDEYNVYAEDLIELGDGVSVNVGLNFSSLSNDNKQAHAAFQPRFALLADGENLHFKLGASRMQQYMHLLTNNGLGLPSDIWLPANDRLAPQKSWIFSTSFGYRLNSGLRFGMDVYYKTLESISSFKEGGDIDINDSREWQNSIPFGDGYAYGLETYIDKVVGKTLFGINYTYSISDRRFPDLNSGEIFPFGLNRTQSLKCSFTYRLSEFSEFLVNWAYMSGNYYSQPIDVSIP